jgi:hypothetical protein
VGGGNGDIEMEGDVGMGVGIEMPVSTEFDVVALEELEGIKKGEKEEELAVNREAKAKHSGKPVITYISRQDWGRRMLKKESHEELVKELEQLEKKYGWEVSRAVFSGLSWDIADWSGEHCGHGQIDQG